MFNLASKLFVAALVSGTGLFGSLAIGSDAMALTGKKFYHEGKEYYCPDNYQPFRYDPNDPYYRYCSKHHDGDITVTNITMADAKKIGNMVKNIMVADITMVDITMVDITMVDITMADITVVDITGAEDNERDRHG